MGQPHAQHRTDKLRRDIGDGGSHIGLPTQQHRKRNRRVEVRARDRAEHGAKVKARGRPLPVVALALKSGQTEAGGETMARWWVALLALAGALAAGSTPAGAQWLRAESPSFIVYSEGGEEQIRRRITLLEDYDRILRALTGLDEPPSPNKLSNQVLFHEYAHHFMSQYWPYAYPRWYVEGFAEYFQTTRFVDDMVEVGRHSEIRGYLVADTGNWMPIEQIFFPRRRPEDMQRFYAQSWLLVHYFFRNDTRRPQLIAFLTAVGRGADPRQAFTEHFQTDMAGLTRDLRAHIRGGVTFLRFRRASVAAPPPITVTRLDVPDALVLADAALRIGGGGDRSQLITRVRRGAANRGDPFSRRVLAHAEIVAGDLVAGDAILGTLLEATPRDAELQYLRGMRYLLASRREPAQRAAHLAQAQRWFARAHRADANHFPTLYRYAETYLGNPAMTSENVSNILLLARRLAPQVDEIAVSAASLLMARGQWADAEALLTPLAADPHGTERANYARTMLEQARARTAPDGIVFATEEAPASAADQDK